ncbi:MAG TPA: metallophosphatase family protein [Candidatus Syntrophoarchaeum butanivorans]|uniref:Metallophosphatase family protein n=1 Tax=Candidatus Syntropharchaeum butanivorans TaxID=1839936 RepID=A0A7C0X091_9EURY|nr:MAG: metallophosphatase family protein [Candidatus Syntrophoarchaeum sp. WYZ-LMO15]HDM35685.1 metallophosphatase family protein [Candidatus Syntrophoarchaeum butanivorans]
MSDLLISDIHADIDSLDLILEVINSDEFIYNFGEIDRIYNLGDVVERGYHPKEVIDRLISLDKRFSMISVRGNHDEAFLYQYDVSGSDRRCEEIHEQLRSDEKVIRYLKSFLPYHINQQEKIMAVHGGPLDPRLITPPGASRIEQWLHERSWQRISTIGVEYFDYYGYHYLPESAFEYADSIFGIGGGYIILCGHEHEPALFEWREKRSQSVLHMLTEYTLELGGIPAVVWELERRPGSSYLLRVGIAGIEGYRRYGFMNPQFGVLFEDEGIHKLGLISLEGST